jgi:4-amino-4-deoxy-L-arabinose transferase-like glycosyltransferase
MRWVCLALLALPYFYYLPVSGILGPDEARYAAIGQEMARSGDWITPVLWGSPWFEKPPLLYWLVALFTKLGFPGEWAIRLPAAIAGLTLAALMPTLEATLVLATSVGWLALSQVAVTDIPLSVCFHLFLMQMLRQRFWTAGVFLGLAILAKGLVPLVLALPMAWQYRREWRPTLAAAVVATPWYLACYARNGRVFFDEFIWKHHVSRFFSSDLQHVQPFWFYLPVILVVLLPWTPAILRRNFEPDERPYLHTALWGLLFFSLSANKLPAYVLPLVPSLALLAARRLVRWHYILAAALFAFLPAFADWVPTAIDDGLSKAITRNVSWSFGLAALAAGFVAQRWPKRTVLVSFLVSIVALKSSVYPALAGSVSAKGSVAKCVPEDASRGYRYSSYFYAGREIPDCPPSR